MHNIVNPSIALRGSYGMALHNKKTVVLTGVHRGPHHAFYTGVKFVVLVQHPVVLF